MRNLEPFKIDLKGLKAEQSMFHFSLDDEYFEAVDAPDIHQGNLAVSVTIHKLANCFEFIFHIQGSVTIPCDLCLGDMEQPIESDNRLVVALGDDYSDEDDLVTVSEKEGILDTSWLIYEFIELSIPIKHVHAPGKCDPAMTETLNAYLTTRSSEENMKEHQDSRWAGLDKLKTIIKE